MQHLSIQDQIFFFFFFFTCTVFQKRHEHIDQLYKEGRSQRLKRAETRERNHDKKAIAAESLYLLQSFAEQYGTPTLSNTSATLAVEQEAAKARNDRTYITQQM